MRQLILLTAAASLLSLPPTGLACEGKNKTMVGAAQPAADLPAADTLIAKHLQALGGHQALKAKRTLTFTLLNKESGDRVVVYQQRPNLLRKEKQIGGAPLMVRVFDGQHAWSQSGTAQPAMLSERETQMMCDHAEFDDPFVDYKQRGVVVEVIGVEAVRGAPAYKLRVTHKNGDVAERYLDKKSLLEVRRVVRFEKDGKTVEKNIYFQDYRPVDGIYVNHVVEFEESGRLTRMTLHDASYDRPLSASLFQPPSGLTQLARSTK